MGSSVTEVEPRATDVRFTDDEMTVTLADGRKITVPLVWYPRLLKATSEQRDRWSLIGKGYGIHWPDVDEDLSVEGMLRGARSPEARAKTETG
jgi:hypothetical protein